MPNCPKKTFKLKFDSCLTAVKFLTWLNFQNKKTSNIPEISPGSVLKYSKITHRYAKELSIHLVLVLKTSHWYRFHPFYLSISPVLWHKCQRVFLGQLHLSRACWELWLSDDQPHSDYNGQWQRALCILAVLQSSQLNPQWNEKY